MHGYLEHNKRNQLARFRCGPSLLQTVVDRFNETSDHLCKLCKTSCIPDEYHLLLRRPRFDEFRSRKLGSLGPSPNMYTLHQGFDIANFFR